MSYKKKMKVVRLLKKQTILLLTKKLMRNNGKYKEKEKNKTQFFRNYLQMNNKVSDYLIITYVQFQFLFLYR